MTFLGTVRRQKLLSFTLILFTLSVGVVIGTLVSTGVKAEKAAVAAPGATPLTVPSAAQMQSLFRDLVKSTEPSVVNISTQTLPRTQPQARQRRRSSPEDEGGNEMQDFFERFFGGPSGPGGPFPEMPPGRRGQALGSGVVVDKAGYVLTNNHVVENADRIKVKFSNDPTEYDAKLIGADPLTDLAVIKIEPKKTLVPARIGNSDAVQVGDWAIAIGSPFGFQATVTAGIISAKERDVPEAPRSQFQHYLQTDAAINPGNSGGPLLNINGEVIGINTAIATRSGGYQGVGFAMPINTAVKVYNQVIRSGKVTRGSIGIKFQRDEMSHDLLRAYGATEGVFVQSVVPGGPAEKAGLRAEDIIVAINGKPVRNGTQLVDIVTETAVGDTLKVTVLRDKQRRDFPVTIGDLTQVHADTFGVPSGDEGQRGEGAQARFGMTIENLSEARRQNLNFNEAGGVLVTQIEPGSFAEDVGLQRNDIVLSINRQPVKSVDDVRRIQGALKAGEAVAFRLMRQARGQWQPLFLAGTLPANQ
ncbi:MAG: Do family serine endopeptidase [Acidobacteria bacterium]|nr:Do family serine endopeptidase [Acidobacteriota bacterium]